MINDRKLYNITILNKLTELAKQYPDMRFGQLLFNTGIIQGKSSEDGSKLEIQDPFYEESERTWDRMTRNSLCFPN